MTVKWEEQSGSTGKLSFTIDKDSVSKAVEQAFNKVKGNLNVPGFRKGKVTRKVFNEMYGEEALFQDALNIVLPAAYENALKESKVEPVAQPEIDIVSMESGKDWEIVAEIATKPSVKLGQYKDLTVEKQNRKVLVKDINEVIEKMRHDEAELVPKETPSKDGDTVVIDYKGTVDGKPFEGGSAENYSLKLGSNTFIPGFEDQLIGEKPGSEVDVKVTFPEDYQASDLAGKEAIFATKVNEVKYEKVPKLDDEFAKDVDAEVSSVDELKEKIKKDLQNKKEAEAIENIEDEALKVAVKNAEIGDIPKAMIENEIANQEQQYFASMQQQGISKEMFLQLTGQTEDQFRQQFVDGAEDRVKATLVLEQIVIDEKINPSKADINEEIESLAEQFNMEKDAVAKALTEDMLKHDIGIKQAVSIVRDSAIEK